MTPEHANLKWGLFKFEGPAPGPIRAKTARSDAACRNAGEASGAQVPRAKLHQVLAAPLDAGTTRTRLPSLSCDRISAPTKAAGWRAGRRSAISPTPRREARGRSRAGSPIRPRQELLRRKSTMAPGGTGAP